MTYAPPPARTEISDTYPNPSNAVARIGFGSLWDYVTGLLGSTGNPAEAITALTAAGLNTANSFTLKQEFNGTSANACQKTFNILEGATVSATASTGVINYDVATQSVLYYTTNATGNFTLNFRGSSTTTLNNLLANGESVSVTFLCTNGASAYYNSVVTIDGTTVIPKWQGGQAPTIGNPNAVDIYNMVIVKTATNTYTVFGSLTKFA
jgi:hypothetical protein